MSCDVRISETLKAVLSSGLLTAVDSNIHAQVQLHRNGLVIAVNSAADSAEQLIPWDEIDGAFDLEVLVSGETLLAVEKVKRSASAAPYLR